MEPGKGSTILNVAEKRSVAEKITQCLCGREYKQKKCGPYEMFVFKYNTYQMLMTYTNGHVMDYNFSKKSSLDWSNDPAELFDDPIEKIYNHEKSKAFMNALKKKAIKTDFLYLWLDDDPEGENIACAVKDICKSGNSTITVLRPRLAAVTHKEIVRAFDHPTQLKEYISEAVDARKELDLRMGFSFTRFQDNLLSPFYSIKNEGRVISYGSCQFPALGFIVEQQMKVSLFAVRERVPEYTITCCLESQTGHTTTFTRMKHNKPIVDESSAGIHLFEKNPSAHVKEASHIIDRVAPPYPLTTIVLEKLAATHLKMTSEITMKVAQELYESGFISYPRTDTDSFPEFYDLKDLVRNQIDQKWGPYAKRLLEEDQGKHMRVPRSGSHNDKSHLPLHPTESSFIGECWSKQHQDVYELIATHFLACVSEDAIVKKSTVVIKVNGDDFSAHGTEIILNSFYDVYGYEQPQSLAIPLYQTGEHDFPATDFFVVDAAAAVQPTLLTESDLLSLMYQEGIGTPGTTHTHIRKLIDCGYATKCDNLLFSATDLGMALFLGYTVMALDYELYKPNLRNEMATDFKAICSRDKTKSDFLDHWIPKMKKCLADATSKKNSLLNTVQSRMGPSDPVVRRCKFCQSPCTLRQTTAPKFRGRRIFICKTKHCTSFVGFEKPDQSDQSESSKKRKPDRSKKSKRKCKN